MKKLFFIALSLFFIAFSFADNGINGNQWRSNPNREQWKQIEYPKKSQNEVWKLKSDSWYFQIINNKLLNAGNYISEFNAKLIAGELNFVKGYKEVPIILESLIHKEWTVEQKKGSDFMNFVTAARGYEMDGESYIRNQMSLKEYWVEAFNIYIYDYNDDTRVYFFETQTHEFVAIYTPHKY